MNTDVEFLGLYDRMASAKHTVQNDVARLLFVSSKGTYTFSKKIWYLPRCVRHWIEQADPLEDSITSVTSFLTTVHRRNRSPNREDFKQKLQDLITVISQIADHVIGRFQEKLFRNPSALNGQRLAKLRAAQTGLQHIIQAAAPSERRQASHDRTPSATMLDIADLQQNNALQEAQGQVEVQTVEEEGAGSMAALSPAITPALSPMIPSRAQSRSRNVSGRVSTSLLPSIAEHSLPTVNDEDAQALWRRLHGNDTRAIDEILASGDMLQYTILKASEENVLLLFSHLLKTTVGKEKIRKLLSQQEEYPPILYTLADRKLEKVLTFVFSDFVQNKEFKALATLLQAKAEDQETVWHVLAKRGLQDILKLGFKALDAIDEEALKMQKRQKLAREAEVKIKSAYRTEKLQLLQMQDARKTTLFFRMLQACDISFLALTPLELIQLLEPVNNDNENGIYFLFDETGWKKDKSKLIISVLDTIKKTKTAGKLFTIPQNASRTPFSISFATRKTLRTQIIRKTLTRVLELQDKALFRHLATTVGSHTLTNVSHYMAHDKEEGLMLFKRLQQAEFSCDDILALLRAKDTHNKTACYYAASAGNLPMLEEFFAFFKKPTDRAKFLPLMYDVALVMSDNGSKTLFNFLTKQLSKDELERLLSSAGGETNTFFLVRAAKQHATAPLEMALTYFNNEPERLVRILTELMFHVATENAEDIFERIRQKMAPRDLLRLLVTKDANDVSPVFMLADGKSFSFLQNIFDYFMRIDWLFAVDLILTTKDSPRTLIECVLGTQDLESFALGKHIFDCILTKDEKVIQSIAKQAPAKLNALLSSLVRVAPGFVADYANGSAGRSVEGHPNFVPMLKTLEDRNIQAGYIPILSMTCDFPNSIKELLSMRQLKEGIFAQYRDHLIAWKLYDSLELFQNVNWTEELDDSGNTLAHYMVQEELVRTYAECTKRDGFHRAAMEKQNGAGKTAEELALESSVFQAYRKRISSSS